MYQLGKRDFPWHLTMLQLELMCMDGFADLNATSCQVYIVPSQIGNLTYFAEAYELETLTNNWL